MEPEGHYSNNLYRSQMKRLREAKQYASEVRAHYQEEEQPDDALLSTMSAILVDLSNAMLTNKPFRSKHLAAAFLRGYTTARSPDSPWLLRFGHSFLLVMTELERRDIRLPEAPFAVSITPPEIGLNVQISQEEQFRNQPNLFLDTVPAEVKVEPIEQSPIFEAFSKDVKEEPIDENPIVDPTLKEVKEEPIESPIYDVLSMNGEKDQAEEYYDDSPNIANSSSYNSDSAKQGPSREEGGMVILFDNRTRMQKCIEIDEELIDKHSIPHTVSELVDMPYTEFICLQLTEEQFTIAKEIRERGKRRKRVVKARSKSSSNIASTSRAKPLEIEPGSSTLAFKRKRKRKAVAELLEDYGIPATASEIIEMPRSEFDLMPLTEEQRKMARIIRRKGRKNLSSAKRNEERKLSQPSSTDITYVYDHEDDSD